VDELFATFSWLFLFLLNFALVIYLVQSLEVITTNSSILLSIAESRWPSCELDIATISSFNLLFLVSGTIVFVIFLLHVIGNFDHILLFGLVSLRLDDFMLDLNFVVELIVRRIVLFIALLLTKA
jgi:hypothetical protein